MRIPLRHCPRLQLRQNAALALPFAELAQGLVSRRFRSLGILHLLPEMLSDLMESFQCSSTVLATKRRWLRISPRVWIRDRTHSQHLLVLTSGLLRRWLCLPVRKLMAMPDRLQSRRWGWRRHIRRQPKLP